MKESNLAYRPLKLKHNRVWRPFAGGKLLDVWQGKENPIDGNKGEEWVASMVEARNPDSIPEEGLSRTDTGDGEDWLLKDLILRGPGAFLGENHIKKHGNNMGILVKVLDACTRLMIQVHPDKDFAKTVLQSDFGKTEAWYILGGRNVNGEAPYVLLGFKPGITKEKWKALYEKQDVEGMISALHKFYVKPGDAFFVEGGVPHAAGAGCFFVEIQEPTDYTMRTEKISPMGVRILDIQLHQGVGLEKMFDCFHYEGYTREEILDRWQLKPASVREEPGGREIHIISPAYTSCFSMSRIEVDSNFSCPGNSFSVAVVTKGTGKLQWDGGEMEIGQADELFLPAAVGSVTWVNGAGDAGKNRLEVILCHPPA